MHRTIPRGAAILLLAVLGFIAPGCFAQPAIRWNVVDRMPMLGGQFSDIDLWWNSAKHEKSMHAFALDHMDEVTGHLFPASDPGVIAAYSRALKLTDRKVVTVRLESPNSNGPCRWSIQAADSKRELDDQACVVQIADVEVGSSLTVTLSTSQGEVSSVVDPQRLVITAMGDSFASGEGNPDRAALYQHWIPTAGDWYFRDNSPAEVVRVASWWNEECHRSLQSWPVLVTLNVALTSPHHVVELVDVACSGAEFFDGIFLAQERDALFASITATDRLRDGAGPRYALPNKLDKGFVARSQIDAIRDALCSNEDANQYTALPLMRHKYFTAARNCIHPVAQSDVLLLSAGGNDINFAGAVKGILVPDTVRKSLLSRTHLPQLGQEIVRKLTNSISVAHLSQNIASLEPVYPGYMAATIRGANSTPAKTVLVAYPNPVAKRREGADASTRAGELSCFTANGHPRIQDRIQFAFMSFSLSAKALVPFDTGKHLTWTVWIDGNGEVEPFVDHAYPQLMNMQHSLNLTGVRTVDFIGASSGFEERLLCSKPSVDPGVNAAEPYFFCSPGANADHCDDTGSGESSQNHWSDYANRDLGTYRALRPGRRIVNSLNDSLLALRSWPTVMQDGRQRKQRLESAMAGSVHPVFEAHAVAADSAFESVCQAIKTRRPECSGAACASDLGATDSVCSGR
jgi:hypothetical protein